VPASIRSQNDSGMDVDSLSVPVPPCTSGSGSRPGRTQRIPVPAGPSSHLCPAAKTTSAPKQGAAPPSGHGTIPSDCAESRIVIAPRSRATAAIVAASCTQPVTLEAWASTTARVPGSQPRATAAGSTRPAESQGTTVSSITPRAARWWSGRRVALWSAAVASTRSPGRSRPWSARFAASVAPAGSATRSGSTPPSARAAAARQRPRIASAASASR
jgi:hypothetical protein